MFKARKSALVPSDRKKFESQLRDAEAALRAASQAVGPASSPSARGEALEAKGLALFRLGRFDEAVDTLEQASELLLSVSFRSAILAFGGLSASLLAVSRFEEVVRLHERLETHFAEGAMEHSHWLGFAPISLAHVVALRNLDRLDEAYAAAGTLAQRLRRGTYVEQIRPGNGRDGQLPPASREYVAGFDDAFLGLKRENRRTLVSALLEQASIARLQRQRAEAHTLINEAIEHSHAVASFSEFSAGLAQALWMRGKLFEEAGDTQQATGAFDEALSRLGDSADPKVRAWVDRARLSRQTLRN